MPDIISVKSVMTISQITSGEFDETDGQSYTSGKRFFNPYRSVTGHE